MRKRLASQSSCFDYYRLSACYEDDVGPASTARNDPSSQLNKSRHPSIRSQALLAIALLLDAG